MSLRQEFHCRNLCLGYFREDVFFLSQWNLPPIIFLIYRLIVSVYTTGWFIYAIVSYEKTDLADIHNPMAFLTMWSYLLLALHLLLAFVNGLFRTLSDKRSCLRRPSDDENHRSPEEYCSLMEDANEDSSSTWESEVRILSPYSIPWYLKLDWVLFSMCSQAAILVTTVFFAFLYPALAKQAGLTSPTFMDINVHALNTVIIFLELMIAAYPIRLLHFIYPLMYGLTYVIFSAIYWSFDHKKNVLYPGVLDWNDPGRTSIFIVVIAASLIVMQIIFYCLFRLKVSIYKRCFHES